MTQEVKKLYWLALVAEGDMVYNQKDAEGFIRINGLRLKIANLMRRVS